MKFAKSSPKAWFAPETNGRTLGWLVAAVSAIYLAVVLVLASTRQFWNDELFTFYISRRPGLSEVWKALLTGAEQIPPLFYVITRACTALFGPGYLAFRLPEILGFLAMMLSLYFFVRARSSAAHGLLAMSIPLVTEAFFYSYEARPYGLVLGFSGLALLFWRAAAEGCRRTATLIGLSLSLGAAVSCHYYAVLVFLPFVLGESVRIALRRRMDVPVLLSIGGGLLPLAVFLPLVRAARGFSATFWAKPQWTNIPGFYVYLMYPGILLLVVIPIILAAGFLLRGGESDHWSFSSNRIPAHEVAAAIGFVLIPLVAVFLAKTITGGFTFRYAIPAVLGVSILLAWSVSIVSHNRPVAAIALGLFATSLFAIAGFRTYHQFREAARSSAETMRLLRDEAGSGVPIVVAAPHTFFELSYLGGREGAPWLTYLADPQLAIQYTGTDDVDLGLINLKNWAPLQVHDFGRFRRTHPAFLIYGDGAPFSWIVQELTKENWEFTVKNMAGRNLLLATRRGGHSARDATAIGRSVRE